MSSSHDDHKHPLYIKRSRELRRLANLNPATRCWRCGRTKAEHGSRWTAGHTIHGDSSPTGPLAPECWKCMCSSGAKYGNELRGTPSKRDRPPVPVDNPSRWALAALDVIGENDVELTRPAGLQSNRRWFRRPDGRLYYLASDGSTGIGSRPWW
ncbi:MAG: hypothetical protein AB7Q42_06015 [Acidimicrobiia bacterium]